MRHAPKYCKVCGRQMTWRKKWRHNWEQVRYCSKACRQRGLTELDRRSESVILALLKEQPNADGIQIEAANAKLAGETARARQNRLVQATRNPGAYSDDLARWIRYGASPRASIALARCARALAWMRGDDYVSPEHIQQVAPEVLRHRLLLTFEAEAEAITTDDFIQNLLELVAIP